MMETTYSSVIWFDGIEFRFHGPWPPWAWEMGMITLEIISRDRDEIEKATMDMMCFGTGVTRVSADGGVKHVPVSEWGRR